MVLRIATGLTGALLIYAAGFVYEDREGRVEGWMGMALDRVKKSDDALVAKHTSILRRESEHVGAWLNRLFGDRRGEQHRKRTWRGAFGVAVPPLLTRLPFVRNV